MSLSRLIAALACTATLLVPALPSAKAAGTGVNIGVLDCQVGEGVGYIIGSNRSVACIFKRADGTSEHYHGEIRRWGLDIGFSRESRMFWGVLAPGHVEPGALSGTYAGAGADVAAGLGVGANALFGGNARQIALQPVTVNGSIGVNVAAGVAKLTLAVGK
ncbi:DUF992 domain-containing protein [Dongia sp.]|jgi:hypothetical protein|uniref:DUF992 domain-containing protein n=1 Tax=Dongia sp. TaxID=1977262 RepID=UPI0035B0CCBD